MSRKITRHYLRVGKKDKGFVHGVRKCMKDLFGEPVSTEMHISGGRAGDMHQETAEWNLFEAGPDGRVELYTVADESTNGYAECFSVICRSLDEEADDVRGLLEYLDRHDFVSRYSSFEKRPDGYKTFASYLDDSYQLLRRHPFATKDGSGD